MKNTLFRTFTFALLCTLAIACNQRKNQVMHPLQIADSLMATKPDSALTVLEKLQPSPKWSKEETALYALLFTTAQFKNYHDVTNDSLINIAANYWLKSDNTLRKAYSLYYQARVNKNLKKVEQALNYFQKAAEIVEDTEDYKLMSLVHNHWGHLLSSHGLFDKALEKYHKALGYARAGKNNKSIFYLFADIADIYQIKKENEEALKYRQEALEIATHVDEKKLISLAHFNIASTYRQMGEVNKGMKHINIAIINEEDPGQLENMYIHKGELFFLAQNYDSARYYYDKVDTTTTIVSKAIMAEEYSMLEEKLGNHKQALCHYKIYKACLDTIREDNINTQLAELQHKYDYSVIENNNIRLKVEKQKQNNLILIIGFMLFAVVVIGYFYVVRLKRKKEQQLKVKDEFLRQSKLMLQEKTIELLHQQNELQHKTDELLTTIKLKENLNEQLDLYKNKSFGTEKIIQRIDKVKNMPPLQKVKTQKGVALSANEIEDLKQTVNTYYDNFTERLKKRHGGLTEEDMNVCCLMKMQLNNLDISVLLNISNDTLTKKKYRIRKEKINKEVEDLNDYLMNF